MEPILRSSKIRSNTKKASNSSNTLKILLVRTTSAISCVVTSKTTSSPISQLPNFLINSSSLRSSCLMGSSRLRRLILMSGSTNSECHPSPSTSPSKNPIWTQPLPPKNLNPPSSKITGRRARGSRSREAREMKMSEASLGFERWGMGFILDIKKKRVIYWIIHLFWKTE